ncbi:MAG: ATP-binding protein [Vicinamibacterales bacterium]
MSWSIRTRLTAWHLGVVIAVLGSSAVAAVLAQRGLAVTRLDEDLRREMATLRAVMRNEFDEGLDVQGAADEARIEVVAPGRALRLATSRGEWIASWGLPLGPLPLADIPFQGTIPAAGGRIRVLRETIDEGPNRRYTAVVMAPLAEIERQRAEMVRAIGIGMALALAVAGAGGWLVGRQALKPLADMAHQARRVDAHHPRERLVVPHAGDEVEQVAAAFNGLLDRLAASLDQQRQLMADASHELRTPVSVIRTAAQVTLTQAERSSAESRESLVIVGEQADRLARVVDAMFLLSRAEAHGVQLRPEFLNLDEVVSESVRALRVIAQARAVTVTQEGDQEVGLVGDDALLRRLVGNVLDTAIRHAEAGGHVVADVEASAAEAVIRITNDGPEIPVADRQRIFERFVRVGPSEGAGLGLPIARWIAHAHGGTLVLESTDTRHTTFTVTLPLGQPGSTR